jgi:fructokinase
MIDVVCFGEALVDLLPDRRGALRDASRFEVHSGGAPANVAVGLARLGVRTAFVGVVGEDEFGHLLASKLRAESIDVRLRHTRAALTGVWFVALDQAGERSFFAPTGADSADKLLAAEDVERVPQARVFHCGSSAHVLSPAGETLRAAVRDAKARGMAVSFDPNVRKHLWRDLRDLRDLCADVLPFCDVVKLSEDEIEPCLGLCDPREALAALHDLGVRLGCVTLGERGCIARRGAEILQMPAPRVEVVDTTGAGDGFVAGLLASDPLAGDLSQALATGCAIGSRVCTRLGAVAGLPRRAELAPA